METSQSAVVKLKAFNIIARICKRDPQLCQLGTQGARLLGRFTWGRGVFSLRFGLDRSARSSLKPLLIYKGHFGRKGYPL